MGKYMRKVKASGEVAVMEVPGGALLGVRTRSRTLALQRAQQMPPEKSEAVEMADYLELRSRRLEKPLHPQVAARRSAGRKASAGTLPEAAVEDQVSFGENALDDYDAAMERSTRETTPCSLIRNSEMIRTPGSTTKSKNSNSMTSHHRMEASLCRFVPTSIEMEEFFASSERQAQHAFKERYNFCPVNDCPLPGRYEWVTLD